MWKYLAAISLLLALGSCSTEPEVDWSKYPAGLQERVDAAGCKDLQETFDAVADMDDAIRTAHGSGTGDVMSYIDDRLEAGGCY